MTGLTQHPAGDGMLTDDDMALWRAAMKIKEVIRMLEKDGWFLVETRSSHRQYKHATKPGRVTVAGHPSDDVAPGTLNSIRKQARLKEK